MVVYEDEEAKKKTLKDIFELINIDAFSTSVDMLGVHALGACFQRFDLFNQKYNPFGQKTLRDVFLKTDNYIQGIAIRYTPPHECFSFLF